MRWYHLRWHLLHQLALKLLALAEIGAVVLKIVQAFLLDVRDHILLGIHGEVMWTMAGGSDRMRGLLSMHVLQECVG